MAEEKASFMDGFMGYMDKVSGPMTKFGQIPFIQAITRGMVAAVGVTMVGSIFLVITLLCKDGWLTEKAILGFMSPYADKILLVNNLSMGIMAAYMAISIGAEYADVKGFNKTTGAVGSFFAFMLLNYNANSITVGKEVIGAFANTYWGGAGVITAIVGGAVSTNIISICYKKNIRIKLPDSVPPAIADSFSAIIPYFFMAIVCWGLRTIFDINIPQVIGDMLLPIFSAADNVFIYTLSYFLVSALWLCGLHGDNIVSAVTSTFVNTWAAENQTAFAANQALPFVWTPNLNRLFMWVSSCWPILFYMFRSAKKLPHLKPLATICFPPAIFCIIEPMMFGLPIVLNPFLAIPFILAHTITGALTYLLSQANIIGRMCVNLPWATPSPILGYLGTGGNFGAALIVVVNFLIGLVIFYPFWKAYEKAEIKRIEEEEAAAMA